MNGLGSGLAWMGFWLFVGAECASLNYTIGQRSIAREAVKVECIKAGRMMGGDWYEAPYCLAQ